MLSAKDMASSRVRRKCAIVPVRVVGAGTGSGVVGAGTGVATGDAWPWQYSLGPWH
jgi:hypothetical protein